MRQQVCRHLILVAMFGLLIFASVPRSNAVTVESLERCCGLCDRQCGNCLASRDDEFTYCEALHNCQANSPGLCPANYFDSTYTLGY